MKHKLKIAAILATAGWAAFLWHAMRWADDWTNNWARDTLGL